MFKFLTLICVTLWIVNLICHVADGELHRVKSVVATVVKRSSEVETSDDEDQVASPSSTAAGKMTGLHESPEYHLKGSTASLETWLFSLFSAVLVGLSGILPLMIIPLDKGHDLKNGPAANQLKLLLSFAVGSLLGDVFLHLLPEAWNHIKDESGHRTVGMWVMAGVLTFMIIEKIFADEGSAETKDVSQDEIKAEILNKSPHNGVKNRKQNGKKSTQHQNGIVENSSTKVKSNNIHVRGYLNLAANIIDNFTHGLALAGSYLISTKVGVLTTFAILVHEIPHEVGDFAILLRSGFDRWKAAKAQLATASGGILGALTALMASSAQAAGDCTAWILPFSSGGFLYIALVTVAPDLLQEKNHRESVKQVICVCTGIGIMCLVTLLFE